MRPVTVATYFYDGEEFLFNEQLKAWAAWPKHVKDYIECIGIHTGVKPISKSTFPNGGDVDFRLVQIEDCKIWNQSGGRNLAFHLASFDWVAIMDADYIVPVASAQALLDLPIPDPKSYYIYKRNIIAKSTDLIHYKMLEQPKPLSNSTKGNIFIMSKKIFWEMGGNDEDFAGKRGFEDLLFLRQLQARGYSQILAKGVLISHYMKAVKNDGNRKARNVRLFHSKNSPLVAPTNPLRFTWKEL